jgi:hypothetical protein
MEALRRTHAKHKISPRPTKAAPRTTQLASKSLKISFGPTAASIDVLARDAYKNNVNMPRKTIDAISPWFLAAEELGEYIGIRFGRVPAGSAEPEWFFLRHTDYDGIGGLAELLRRRGAKVDNLLQIKYPAPPSWLPLLRALPKYLRPRKRVKWAVLERGIGGTDQPPQPAPAVAWQVFDESTTTQIRRVCRKAGVTVNSFLLKHLTKAIRPSLQDQSSFVPWMIPVNLRGKVVRDRDTANHSSYVTVRVQSYEMAHDIHRNIYDALGRREHWSNWYAYRLGRFLTVGMKKFLIAREWATSQWNLGGFSNLGDWDPEKKITQRDCKGAWLFCPPALRCQVLAAGCVTFQNQLSLTLQTHPDFTTDPSVPQAWVSLWVKEIEMDLASLLEPAATAWPKVTPADRGSARKLKSTPPQIKNLVSTVS